jgi:hypothetical protein
MINDASASSAEIEREKIFEKNEKNWIKMKKFYSIRPLECNSIWNSSSKVLFLF